MKNDDSISDMMVLWDRYNRIRIAGIKKEANKILNEFIVFYKKQDREAQRAFVDDICHQILDPIVDHNYEWFLFGSGIEVSDSVVRIQFPLFRDVVFPELLDRYKNDDPLAIRWLGQFEQFFLKDQTLWKRMGTEIEVDWPDSRYFFEKSYSLEPNQKTLVLLVKFILSHLGDACHEMPSGILLNSDDMNTTVTELRHYWEQLAVSVQKEEWEQRLLDYERIASHWDRYCQTNSLYRDFRDYMSVHDME